MSFLENTDLEQMARKVTKEEQAGANRPLSPGSPSVASSEKLGQRICFDAD